MPSVLFIPDRFMDYRMWGEVPDLIRDRASVVHLDQCMHIPWPAPDEGFLDAVRGLAPREGFDVVAAAGQAARFGFAVASAGLGAGLMLFYPVPDRHLDEVTAAAPDPDPAVMAVVAPQVPALGDVIARRAADAEIIIAKPRLTPVADPAASVAALLRMLSRVH